MFDVMILKKSSQKMSILFLIEHLKNIAFEILTYHNSSPIGHWNDNPAMKHFLRKKIIFINMAQNYYIISFVEIKS